MSRNNLAKFTLLILSLGVLSVANVFAQTSSCALEVTPETLRASTPISGASVTAVNVRSKRIYRSRLVNGKPFFARLPEGEYNLTVRKPGFKQSKETYQVLCENAEEGVLSTSISMVRGNSRQIYTTQEDVIRWVPGGVKLGVSNVSPSGEGGGTGIPVGEPLSAPAKPTNNRVRPIPKIISKGVVNGSATSLPRPEYPPAAKAVRASGTVSVQVTIDENGNVISATAASGHPLLQAAAVAAARQAKFRPTLLMGTPVKVMGIITYNFVAN
jgi:TonB family protein